MINFTPEEIMLDPEKLRDSTHECRLEEHIALHLAGQAVASRILDIHVLRIWMSRSLYAGALKHPQHNEGPLGAVISTDRAWRLRENLHGIYDDLSMPCIQAFEAHITVLLAGAAAERYFCNDTARFNIAKETRGIARLLRYTQSDRKELKRAATRLVDDHSGAILSVAKTLFAEGTIPGTELNAILRSARIHEGAPS